MPNISSIFPEKFKLTISLDFTVSTTTSEEGKPSYSSSATTKLKYESAPLYTKDENTDEELTQVWPDDLIYKLAKKLRVKRNGPGVGLTYDGTTYVPNPNADYYTLDNNHAYVIKGVGSYEQGSLKPTSTIIDGDKTIKNIGYFYNQTSGNTENLGERCWGPWTTNKISKNTTVSTNLPLSTTLARKVGRRNREAIPCFGCIPLGYLGADGATVGYDTGGAVYSEVKFGGDTDLIIGTQTDGTITRNLPLNALNVFYGRLDNNAFVTQPIGTPSDPYYMPGNVLLRSALNDKWGSDLSSRWPKDSFDLDLSYYSGLPNDYLYDDTTSEPAYNKSAFPSVYTGLVGYSYYTGIYGSFNRLMAIFSMPFKNPFNTPSSSFCEKIYANNLKTYQANPYELFISAGSIGAAFRFEVDPTTGFPKKGEGKAIGYKIIGPGAGSLEKDCDQDVTLAWDGSPGVTYRECSGGYADGEGGGSSHGIITTTYSISGSCTIDYEIA